MALFGRESAADRERAERIKVWVQARSPYALFSFLLGVIAVLDFFTLVLGVALGAASIVLGTMALRELRENPGKLGKKLAVAGIVLGSAALMLSACMWGLVYR